MELVCPNCGSPAMVQNGTRLTCSGCGAVYTLTPAAAEVPALSPGRQLQLGQWNSMPLYWNVLRLQGDFAQLLCERIILKTPIGPDTMTFFAGSGLEQWLNTAFRNFAFPADKQPALQTPDGSPAVTLLAAEELAPAFSAPCNSWWWTKTFGGYHKGRPVFVDVDPSGKINPGHYPSDGRIGVRPVIWVNTKLL